jgi:uncharacterized membrane protein
MNNYIIIGVIIVLLDSIYLYNIKNMANSQIIAIQNRPINMKIYGAILCYILLVFGLNYFIINNHKSILDAFLIGIVIYGVYETTNYALFDNWTISFAIIDTVWGGILFALTTKIFYYLQNLQK